MPNENDQNNGFTSRFYMSTPVEGEEPLVERYDIEALRLVDDESRRPVNIGDSTHPVYFLNGVPAQCSGGGSGGGGSDVAIYPKYKGGTLIANFSVDGQNGRIYSPTVAEVYKKAQLWPPVGSTSVFSEVGDNNNNNPFKTMIGSYEFLLIHYAPSNNLAEERTMMLDAQSLKGSLPDNAIFSCHYLSDVFIKCQFTSQDKFEVIESEGIPLNTGENPTMLKCAIKKIEGLQFGVSGENLDQGLTVKQVLWDGIANQLGTYTFKTGTVESFNYIYLHFYASNNQYEERILVIDQEAVINGLAQDPSEAYFTCDISDDLYIKGKFIDINKFTITEIHTKTVDETVIVPILCQIDGICLGSVGTITSGGDTSDCMKKGIDYVTAGQSGSDLIGQNATAEGKKTVAFAQYSHAEGYNTTAYGLNETLYGDMGSSHAEGFRTYAIGCSHAEGSATSALYPSATPSHAEGYYTCASGGASHTEGLWTSAGFYFNSTYFGQGTHAEGTGCIAISDNTHAEGYGTCAVSEKSHTEGMNTYASPYPVSNFNKFINRELYVESNTLCGNHAEGIGTCVIGGANHVEGCSNAIGLSGNFSDTYCELLTGGHGEGYGNNITLNTQYHKGFHIEGYQNKIKMDNRSSYYGCHAEGGRTTVLDACYAHTEGYGAYALGSSDYSRDAMHVEGYCTTGAGMAVHAEGYYTYASGDYSHSSGYRTCAIGNCQTVIGASNEADSNKAFIIGGGSRTYPFDTNLNIFTVDWTGNTFCNGVLTCDSLTQTSSRKVKENIKDMSKEEAEKLLQLKPISFDYIKGEGNKNCYGLIAEEVQEVGINYPVFKGTMKTSSEECLQLDYTKFVPYLIKMIQIQEERINNLEKELERKGVK